jgi:hypothetical protein
MLTLAAGWTLTASALQAATYSFNLIKNTFTRDTATGDVIRLSGAGQFSTGGDFVQGEGAFAIFSSGGGVEHGTWRATGFISFERPTSDYNNPSSLNNGTQFGILSMYVTLYPRGGGQPVENVLLVVDCPNTEQIPPEGTRVFILGGPSFSESFAGYTVFHGQLGR